MVGLLEVSNSIVTSFRLVTLSLFFRESKFKGRIVLNTFHLIWVPSLQRYERVNANCALTPLLLQRLLLLRCVSFFRKIFASKSFAEVLFVRRSTDRKECTETYTTKAARTATQKCEAYMKRTTISGRTK